MFSLRAFVIGTLGVWALFHLAANSLSSYQGDQVVHAELGYANTAPNNEGGGLSIPASCESYSHVAYAGTSCLASSACGTNYGIYQCDGSCSVSAPAVPGGYGSVCYSSANSCGSVNSGTIQCSGACSASTPANPAGYGSVCYSSANSCGSTSSGTIQCNGSCSATTPSNPAGYGTTCYSSPNSCGSVNSGTVQCSGACSASTPSNPVWYGQACTSAGNSCGMTNAGVTQCDGSCSATTPSESSCPPVAVSNCSFSANTTRVVEGSRVILTWSSQYASGCTITGTDADGTVENPSVSFAGTRNTAPLNKTTTYSITCFAADGRGASCTPASIEIEVVSLPRFQEL